METKTKYLLILLGIGILIFLFKIGFRDLWEPDETRYAVVAREMRETGNWVVPHLNGTIYTEKPPLFFWLINLSTFFLGETTELANRLPSALAGLITMFMTFLFGTKLFSARVGLISGLVLGTCFFFPQISRWMMLDSLFCLWFLLAIYYLYQGINSPAKQGLNFLLACIFMALGTLTKGPIGYLPIPIFLICSIMMKEFRKIWNRNLLYAVFLSVGLVMAWLLPAIGMAGKTYGTQNVLHQTIGRFIGGWSHPEAFYFYFIRFPLGFFPWIIFLPWAFSYALSQMKNERREELLLFVWFAFIFLFFTFSKGKKDNYLLPLYPAASILVGRWLAIFWGPSEESGKTNGKLWIPMGLVTLLFLIVWLIILLRPYQWVPWGVPWGAPREIDVYLPFAVWPLFFIVFGGVLSLIFLLRRWNRLSVSCLFTALIITQVYLSMTVPPWFNKVKSMKPFSRQILLRIAPNDELKIWRFQSTGLLYYTGRQIEQIKKVDRFLQVYYTPHRVFMVVEEEDFRRLKGQVDVCFHLVERAKVGHRILWLVSNQAVQ